MKKKTCCFTGHRPPSLPFGFNENDARCAALKKALREQIIHLIDKENVTHFISGMAIGIDMYAAEIVLDLKKLSWHYTGKCDSLRNAAGEVVRISPGAVLQYCCSMRQRNDAPNALYSVCMDKRNKYMVDQSDVVIAVWSGRPSGTGKTVQYAQSQGKPIVTINPNSMKIGNAV